MTTLRLFTFCFYIGKNTYHELVRMLYVLIASLNQFHPDFFLVVYQNLGLTIDDARVVCRKWEVKDDSGERLLLEAEGCDGDVWVEGSAVRNRWHKLSFNKNSFSQAKCNIILSIKKGASAPFNMFEVIVI